MYPPISPSDLATLIDETDVAARRLHRKLALPAADLDDLRQDLLIDVICRLPGFDKRRGTIGAFANIVLGARAMIDLNHGSGLGALYALMPRVYQLAASLPDAPLAQFQAEVRDLPTSTEAERLAVQRIGQNVFRSGLLEYWQGRCPLTGISDEPLLRASHITPWKDCESDAERLDVHNGLLLSALWDAAFDRGLVSFDDAGQPQFSPALSEKARVELRWQQPIILTDKHRIRLAWHRKHRFGSTL